MVRISKQGERRSQSHHRTRAPAVKTGARKEHLKDGFKSHTNALEGELAAKAFIPKIK